MEDTYWHHLFCSRCGTLLRLGRDGWEVRCGQCGLAGQLPPQLPEHRVHLAPTPLHREVLRTYAEMRQATTPAETAIAPSDASAAMTTSLEACPQCGGRHLSFQTVQMRSADEGQTILYYCADCSHRFMSNS